MLATAERFGLIKESQTFLPLVRLPQGKVCRWHKK